MSPIPARPDPSDEAWRGFVARFLAVFVAVLAATLAFVILVDPYDSGRFPSSHSAATASRTATISRSSSHDPDPFSRTGT